MTKTIQTAFALMALTAAAPASAYDSSHAAWTAILREHVRGGRVDYAAIKKGGALRAYLAELESVTPARLRGLSEPERLAFWLNVYNAYTVALVIEHLPLGSIREIGSSPDAAFRTTFIELPATGRAQVSLDFVEHEIVRKRFAEPRVHFALVCAARSCPPLRSEAYRGADLEAQLDDQARGFLNDRSHNRWHAKSRTLYLSKILDWFAGDFTKTGMTMAQYVARYIDGLDAAAVARTEYLAYDWALNGT